MLTKLWNDQRGVTAIEYGLIAALIAVAIIGILSAVGKGLTGVFTSVNTQLGTA
jgi:pilus assembly protein Flp/PilA